MTGGSAGTYTDRYGRALRYRFEPADGDDHKGYLHFDQSLASYPEVQGAVTAAPGVVACEERTRYELAVNKGHLFCWEEVVPAALEAVIQHIADKAGWGETAET